MKRLLGLLLVMGTVGCGASEWVSKDGKWVQRGDLMYEANSETPFTGVVVLLKYENGKKYLELTYKDGKKDGLETWWHSNGQKWQETTYKDGKEVSKTMWDEEGNVEEQTAPAAGAGP